MNNNPRRQNSCTGNYFYYGRRNLIFLLLAVPLILSCRSDGNLLKDERLSAFTLMAKVFNGENRSCPGVLVVLTNSRGQIYRAQTDITGKALFPPLSFDTYKVTMRKEGYEQVDFLFCYSRPDQALYGRLYSFDNLLEQCAGYMEKQEWARARSWLNRALLLNGNYLLTLFYDALILWKTGDPRKAATRLEEAAEQTGLLPPEMSRFLSDLYEYDLKEASGDSAE